MDEETTTFTYDGDGNLVKKRDGSGTTVYVGDYYEVQGGTVIKYYFAGGKRVAIRKGGVVYYLHGDHLGSTSLVTSQTSNVISRQLYYPYGETRWSDGTLPTDRTFTGQRDVGMGLMHYGARYYHPALGRFISADPIVPEPGNPQDLNRYAYVRNSPLNFTDPTGHMLDPGDDYDRPPPPPPPYDPWAANLQAVWIGISWLFEIGPEEHRYGAYSPLTQALMYDVGTAQARRAYQKAGCPETFYHKFNIDETPGGPWIAYGRENLELVGSFLGFGSPTPEEPINPVGGLLGSYDVYITHLPNNKAQIDVVNQTDWESGLRMPGKDYTMLPEVRARDRSKTSWADFLWIGPVRIPGTDDHFSIPTTPFSGLTIFMPEGAGGLGGITRQHFTWIERIPCR